MGGHNPKNNWGFWDLATKFFKGTALWVLIATILPVANAAKWNVTPTLTLSQTYSDNINLDPSGQEESCFSAEILPGLSILPREEGGRIQLSFSTRFQSPLILGCDETRSSLFIQYQSSILAEIIKESFFIESQSSISQQNSTSTGRSATDGRSNTGNVSNVRTFSISPYWTPHWGSYASGEFRLRFNTVTADNNDQGSDSSSHAESIQLQSGSKFSNFSWQFDFSNQEEIRDSDAPSVVFRQYNGQLGYRLSREFNVFVRGAISDNQFESSTSSNRNGTSYSAGAGWAPTPRLNFQAGFGKNNYFFTTNYNPTRRTSLSASWNHNDVGTNTGDTYSFDLSHRTRRTNWNASYSEATTTTQQILLQQQIFNAPVQFTDPNTGLVFRVIDPNTGLPITIPIPFNVPTLTDEVLETKRGQVSVSGNTARHTLSLSLFSEKRTFQTSGQKQDVVGWNGSWNWQLGRSTSSSVQVSWQETDGTDNPLLNSNSRKNEVTRFSISLNRTLSRYISANAQYSFTTQESDFLGNEFDENRIFASLAYSF